MFSSPTILPPGMDGVPLSDPTAVAYRGRRTADGTEVVRLDARRFRPVALSPRPDRRRPSPPGFGRGEVDPGTTALALAILADAIDHREAMRLHEDFGRLVVSKLDPAGWELSREQVRRWVRHQQGFEE